MHRGPRRSAYHAAVAAARLVQGDPARGAAARPAFPVRPARARLLAALEHRPLNAKPTKAAPALTHLDRAGRPAMVDVGAKPATARAAVARCRVRFPAAVAAQLRASGMSSKKGAVIDTAIVAGTMAVKRTHELIPFCHPLPIDGCRFAVDWDGDNALSIECEVRTVHRTGVEMEALTGATVAALTVYDMCKALSHAIVIGPAKLIGKRGGKRDFGAVAGAGA
ncbi:cyclic pyranopterin monophosphate synthase MoaC [Lysobacter enzymogenes]|uniref:cyclic pyranopterin monophosphate synthase n=1 Tax=Lysobacter enzymogenes TaxID=69 RepID=A0A3N2RD30_LYSEN|nr:cyclic pyranopterin monophosphate synthase MoaC [Lysobacter enzymogenes]